jgi:hypothetical protein
MVDKSSIEMIIVVAKEIKRLQETSECPFKCESKEVKTLPSVPQTSPLESSLPYAVPLLSVPTTMHVCSKGYVLQQCPTYRAKITEHKENIRTLLDKI